MMTYVFMILKLFDRFLQCRHRVEEITMYARV